MSSLLPQSPLPPHPGGRAEKLHALTGLRFAAAAMIDVHHSRRVLWLSPAFLRAVSLQCGVSFFFVLSGFILTHVYPTLSAPGATRRFLIARFARVWPAHAFTFLLTIALGLHAAASPLITAANALMLHAWVPVTAWFFSYNSVSWSISTELFFYFAFPLLILRLPQTWWWKAAAVVIVVALLVSFCDRANIPGFESSGPFEINLAGILYISPLARLAEFFLGMVAAMLWKRHSPRFHLRTLSATALECAALALCAVAIVAASSKATLQAHLGDAWATYIRHGGAAPAFAILIVLFASQMALISRAFGSGTMILLGEISFSIYLLHQIFLRWIVTHRPLLPMSDGLLYALFCAALVISSSLVWRLVERPARGFLLKFALPPQA